MNLALRCSCGSLGFHHVQTEYTPSRTLRARLKGLVDAHISGRCARCDRTARTVIRDTRRGQHDPIDLY